MTQPIIAQLTITLEDGATLTGRNDLELARKWAEHVYGDEWAALAFSQESGIIATALGRVRESFAPQGGE